VSFIQLLGNQPNGKRKVFGITQKRKTSTTQDVEKERNQQKKNKKEKVRLKGKSFCFPFLSKTCQFVTKERVFKK
jgi:hypothetical protein